MLHALIMAGGGGTRFWPRSRQRRPKQFLTLIGEGSLLQQTALRIEGQVPAQRTWIITSVTHREETGRQLPNLAADHIVGEPCGRDTAACIGLGAALIARHDSDAVMLVMPADHVIEPAAEFRRAIHVAEQLAQEHPSSLITFGIVPTYPATGYGYIHRGPEIGQRQGVGAYRVSEFREKPDSELAERFVATGEYYWNSGIFVWKAAAILSALRERQPAHFAAVLRIADAWATPARDRVFEQEYEALAKISIDYAVLEQARDVLVVQVPFRWDDVGSWLAVERMHPQDRDHNTVLATHSGIRTERCIVVADPGRLIATVGVDNLIIVQDGDVTLIADRREENAVKQLVDMLKQQGLEKYL